MPKGDLPWQASGRRIGVMGVVNVTPDSFHPASRAPGPESAADHIRTMVAEGADVLDVGGESTRPGACEVPAAEELARVLPVIEAARCAHANLPVSVDTYKASVARAATLAGATIVNDVSGGLLDDDMPHAIADSGATIIIGHIRGTPATMRDAPGYDDVVQEVTAELAERVATFRAAGVDESRIWIDPGIGFGKGAAASRELLFGLGGLAVLGLPVVIGLSRKSFLAAPMRRAGLGETTSDDRLEASLAAAVLAAERGAVLVRAHDVGPTRRALALLEGEQA
ncbi:MAG: dihydropteroate synthase [Candidatus Binatia bacterium]|nr:dihydropteroate synthase [Candidatus Binatia bacterium]